MNLIGIDLDGTLLTDKGTLSTYTKETIQAVCEKGHKVVIATGRHLRLTMPIVEELKLVEAVVCFNGAYIQTPDKQVPSKHSYRAQDIGVLVNLLNEWSCKYVIGAESGYFLPTTLSEEKEKRAGLPVPIQLIENIAEIDEPIFKTSILGTEKELEKVERNIEAVIPELRVVRSGEDSLDVIHPKASKGSSLAWLAEYYDISQQDTIAFGNYYNDVDMLSFARVGVAMKNAPLPIKQSADYVTKRNEEDGVAFVLDQLFLQSKGKRYDFLEKMNMQKSIS